jgi:hypothetical protein
LAIIAADTISRGGFELEDFSSHSSTLSEIKLVMSRETSVMEREKQPLNTTAHTYMLSVGHLHPGPLFHNCSALYLTSSRNFLFIRKSFSFLSANCFTAYSLLLSFLVNTKE